MLEVVSNGRVGEVSIHFRNGSDLVTLRKLNYRLADNTWHYFAVTLEIQTGIVTLRLDCQVVYTTTLSAAALDMLKTRDLALWRCQRNPNDIWKQEWLKVSHALPILDSVYTGICITALKVLKLETVKPAAGEFIIHLAYSVRALSFNFLK